MASKRRVADETPPKNEYERQRWENMKRNEARQEELELKRGGTNGADTEPPAAKRKRAPKKAKTEAEAEAPARRSSRQRGEMAPEPEPDEEGTAGGGGGGGGYQHAKPPSKGPNRIIEEDLEKAVPIKEAAIAQSAAVAESTDVDFAHEMMRVRTMTPKALALRLKKIKLADKLARFHAVLTALSPDKPELKALAAKAKRILSRGVDEIGHLLGDDDE